MKKYKRIEQLTNDQLSQLMSVPLQKYHQYLKTHITCCGCLTALTGTVEESIDFLFIANEEVSIQF